MSRFTFVLASCLFSAACAPTARTVDGGEAPGDYFPRYPPIADADPSIREERDFLVPTRLRIVRGESRIAVGVDPDSLESITLDVGVNMVAGFKIEQFVYRDGEVACPGVTSLSTRGFVLGTNYYNTNLDGVPQCGEIYEIELRLEIFETDIPGQHLWGPKSPKYRVLWTRTLRQGA